MGTVRSLLADLRDVATRERTEGTTRRRPGDAARAALAVLLLIPLVVHAHHPTATEEAVVRLFDSIPDGARALFLILYQLAALWAVGLLVVTVLLLRRWRLARDLAVAAVGAWVLGRLMAFLVHDSGLWNAFKVTFDLTGAPGSQWCASRWRSPSCSWRHRISPDRPGASASRSSLSSRCPASTSHVASPPT